MVTVYGIKNCDTVKKACHWLKQHDVEHQFHDFRKDGLSQAKVNSWMKNIDWETLLNRRSTTWRKLSDQDKESINKSNVVKLMVDQPTLIKRPVIETNNEVIIGFSEEIYQNKF